MTNWIFVDRHAILLFLSVRGVGTLRRIGPYACSDPYGLGTHDSLWSYHYMGNVHRVSTKSCARMVRCPSFHSVTPTKTGAGIQPPWN